MKKILFLSLILAFVACGNSAKDEAKGTEESNKEIKSTGSNSQTGDCDEFLDKYEEWVDELIKVYEQAKKNPLDLENTGRLVEISQEMAKWSEDWANLKDCSENAEFASRIEELQKKAEDAMGTLNGN
jgi:hypothetical protein